MRLIVAEKPSVARDLARALGVRGRGDAMLVGESTCITWCLGHIVELCPPNHYKPAWQAWRLDTLPMLPKKFALQVRAGADGQWRILRQALRDERYHEIVNACDAGREGELIFRWVYALADCRTKVVRLWLSSLTEQAIKTGMGNLRPATAYDDLAAAAACRSQADWLVGLNATRALTRVQTSGVLYTVGRVQTPTLALLVARAHEIDAFVPKPFWQVRATFCTDAAPERTYTGTLQNGKEERFLRREDAACALAPLQNKTGKVHRVQERPQIQKVPKLFDLTSLQRHANTRVGLRAEATLASLQALYERHKLITYPRTDSNYLTHDMQPDIHRALRSLNIAPYEAFVAPLLQTTPLPLPAQMICDAEVGDHHAIIPTGRAPQQANLSAPEAQLFDMVARRFLANFAQPARFAHTAVITHVAADKLYTFISRGTVCSDEGFLRIEPPPKSAKAPTALPLLHQSETVQSRETKLTEGKTTPPPRYTDASLLAAMERAGKDLDDEKLRLALKDAGLGTPATRAAILESLVKRGHASRDGRSIDATAQGCDLIAALPVDCLKSAQLTGDWEAKLAKVAHGQKSAKAFMQEVEALTTQAIRAIIDAPRQPAKPAAATETNVRVASPRPATTSANVAPKLPACPRCHRAHLVRGKSAWGCPRFAAGCHFAVPYEPFEIALDERLLCALVRRGRAGPLPSASHTEEQWLILDLTTQPPLRLTSNKDRG